MTHRFEDEKSWNLLSAEEKLNVLHQDIGKLFSVVEELNHKHHVLVDAISLIHARLDKQDKILRHVHEAELSN